MAVALIPVLLLLGLVGLMLFDLTRRPSLRRMALRNIVRRPTEALLVVGGAALGTAIITSALVVGDTFDASIRDIARTNLGPVDEVVDVPDAEQLAQVQQTVDSEPVAGVDGTLPVTGVMAAVATSDQAEPAAQIAEVDFDDARAFGDDPEITGMADAGATPRGDEAVINDDLADEIGVQVGDEVDLHAYGTTRSYTVRTILPQVGLAGYGQMYVPPGTLAELSSTATTGDSTGGGGAEPPFAALLVSNVGGVFDGADRTDQVVDALDERFEAARAAGIADVSGTITAAKQDLLDDAEDSGAEVRNMFTMMGVFSMVVGVLLLVNLFVMLAEERKSELGMLRAVGMKRNHLVRLFGLEGGVYSLVAAGIGMVLGIGAGQLMTLAIAGILSDEEGLSIVFSADPGSLLAGALAGLAISLLTVWGTSTRIARLNVIRAIRELPEPPVTRSSWRRMVLGVIGMALGLMLLNAGLSGDSAIPTLIGPALALASAVPLLGRWLPRRPVVAGAGALAAFWAIASVELVPEAFEDSDIEMFVVQGLVLVGASVALVSQADRVWAWLADRLADRGGLASRLAVAYPLARRVRTAILLAMFSLIIFTLTFMSALTDANLAQAPAMAEDASAGWDLWVDTSPTSPLASEDIASVRGVEASALVLRGLVDTESDEADDAQAPMTGIDASFLEYGTPELDERLDRFPNDQAAVEAVLQDPTLAVTSQWIAPADGPPEGGGVEVGDEVMVTNPLTGTEQRYTVAAVLGDDWLESGLMVSRESATTLLGDRAVESRQMVKVTDGANPETVADRLTADFVDRGADAETFTGVVEDEMRQMQGFIRLLQGYLGLGLVIGIAGLGVVMLRAVRERRRQIGMLRALGFSSQVVRRAFLSEAAFVAIQGITLGIGLGLVTSYQMVTSDVWGDPLPFKLPWLAVAILLVIPAAAALAATAAPASQAAKIRPAAALRIAE